MHDDHEHHMPPHGSHDHDEQHTEQRNASDEERDKLVLGYMIDHNIQHVSELIELATKFENAGCMDTASIIRGAVDDFQIGNEKLNSALNTL